MRHLRAYLGWHTASGKVGYDAYFGAGSVVTHTFPFSQTNVVLSLCDSVFESLFTYLRDREQILRIGYYDDAGIPRLRVGNTYVIPASDISNFGRAYNDFYIFADYFLCEYNRTYDLVVCRYCGLYEKQVYRHIGDFTVRMRGHINKCKKTRDISVTSTHIYLLALLYTYTRLRMEFIIDMFSEDLRQYHYKK